MDLDGDGVISMYEMEFFYEEQVEKMEMLGIETLPFQDCLCQVCIHLNHTGTNRCVYQLASFPVIQAWVATLQSPFFQDVECP